MPPLYVMQAPFANRRHRLIDDLVKMISIVAVELTEAAARASEAQLLK